MSFAANELTCDGFLDGKLRVFQPLNGYRAATDPVFLAAAITAKSGQSVLELGCGVGVASLCLGWRITGLQLVGLEVQADYAELARKNAEENHLSLKVIQSDLLKLPPEVMETSFDHVMFNPPYFDAAGFSAPTNTGKQIAHMEETPLDDWVKVAFKRLKPRGVMTVIHLADRLPDLLRALPKEAGDIRILPLASRTGRDAKRVIVSARKASAGPTRLLAPFLIHSGKAHLGDGDDFAAAARAILRDGATLAEFS